MVHSSLSSFAVVSLSVAASLLETFPYHPFNGPFLSLIFRRRLPERGSESFRGFSISSFQWSILSLIFRRRLPERGSESFIERMIWKSLHIILSMTSIPWKDLSSFAVVSLSVAASLLETFPYHPFNGPFLSRCHLSPSSPRSERGSESFREDIILSMVHSSLSSFATSPWDVAKARGIHWKDDMEKSLKDFSISSFQWSIPLSHLSPSSPWAWQRVF